MLLMIEILCVLLTTFCGKGKGDISIAFTTANNQPHRSDKNIRNTRRFYDGNIDCVFESAAESVEKAIIRFLYCTETTVGAYSNMYMRLLEFLEKYEKE